MPRDTPRAPALQGRRWQSAWNDDQVFPSEPPCSARLIPPRPSLLRPSTHLCPCSLQGSSPRLTGAERVRHGLGANICELLARGSPLLCRTPTQHDVALELGAQPERVKPEGVSLPIDVQTNANSRHSLSCCRYRRYIVIDK